MANIGLISCVSLKQKQESKAIDLYISPLFIKSKEYALKRLDRFFILSAKHGLLSPEEKISPYDLTLKNMDKNERMKWSNNVYKNLITKINKKDSLVFLAGENYREYLEPKLKADGFNVASPLYKMSIGEQLQWYSSFNQYLDRVADLDTFYKLIDKLYHGLNSGFKLKETNGSYSWPDKGVYLFFENGEFRKTSPFIQRVVRVGTHAVSEGSKSSLWNRLRTHRGGLNLQGNHRGSIFRLHVGKSLISKYNLNYPTWGIGQTANKKVKASEIELEKKVSQIIGNMNILWLSINDQASKKSDRSFIEKNSIGLLSCFTRKIDTSGKEWLGNFNPNKAVSGSSLWNINYVDSDYDPRFLEILDYYVDVTLGSRKHNNNSIVPEDWFLNPKTKEHQLNLF